jgi:hypothetical protein
MQILLLTCSLPWKATIAVFIVEISMLNYLATRCNYTLSSEDRFLCLPGEPDYLRKVRYHFAVVYYSYPVSYNSINMDVEK